MPTLKITKRSIDLAETTGSRYQIMDTELKGFGVRIEESGTKTYFVRYQIKGLGKEGPRRFIKIGRHGTIPTDIAREEAKKILGDVSKGLDPAGELENAKSQYIKERDAITFQELGELFLREHVSIKRKAKTIAGYETLFHKHASPTLGQLKAEAVTRTHVARLHVALKDTPYMANRLLAFISSLYSYAEQHSHVPESFNPARNVEKYKEQSRERYLSSEEIHRLSETISLGLTEGLEWENDENMPRSKHSPNNSANMKSMIDIYAASALKLLIFTGARVQEVLTLKWSYIDFQRGLVNLPDSKTGKKTLVLSLSALHIINQLKSLLSLEEQANQDGYIIKGSKEGKPKVDLKRPWQNIQRHAKLEGVRLHDLRHTFASIGVGSGLGLPVIGKLLGHSQTQTTDKYAHLATDPAKRAADIIGEHIEIAMKG